MGRGFWKGSSPVWFENNYLVAEKTFIFVSIKTYKRARQIKILTLNIVSTGSSGYCGVELCTSKIKVRKTIFRVCHLVRNIYIACSRSQRWDGVLLKWRGKIRWRYFSEKSHEHSRLGRIRKEPRNSSYEFISRHECSYPQ